MKYPYSLMTFILLAALLLNSCGASAPGPQAWIDTPLDNTIAPLAPLPIMAHASDSNGVAGIEFYANDQLLASVSADGGRLGWAEYEWTPPEPGTYLVGARGIDNNGTAGALATSRVTISGTVTLTPTEEKISTETPTITLTVTNTPVTPLAATIPSVVAKMDANCREGPGTAYEVYGSLLKGQEAVIKGRLADNSWLLIALTGRSSNCWIAASVVDVHGDRDTIQVAAAPPLPQEPPPVQIEPPQPIDTTPPAIYGAGTDKQSMCASDKVTSNVVAYDEGGIYQVYATWSLTNTNGVIVETGYVDYTVLTTANNAYTGVFGPFDYPGTLSINGTVVDNAGNSASFSQTITINCS